jgi:hypothetical protein
VISHRLRLRPERSAADQETIWGIVSPPNERHEALYDKHRTREDDKGNIGIDISKDTLDAHRLSTDETAQFPNTPADLRALRRRIGTQIPDL